MKFNVIFFCVFLFTFSYSQNNTTNSGVDGVLTDYYELDRENIYLHLNKSTYLTNETVWFKGYVIDKKSKKLNYNTNNVYVNILDKSGNIVKRNLFFCSNGLVFGNIALDNNFTSGYYYLHIYTNYMNNFIEDESTLQKIKILNTNEVYEENAYEESYHISIMPESGNLIANTDNSVVVKITDCMSKGLKLSNLIIKDSNNNEITNFSTNTEGYGKFNLINTNSGKYFLHFQNNNINQIKELPLPKSIGFNLYVNNYAVQDKCHLKIRTNNNTLDLYKNKNLKIIIQQNDLVNYIDVKLEQTVKELYIDKNYLNNGINTIALLDEKNNVLAQRVIYNQSNDKPSLNIISSVKKGDSLVIKGTLPNRIANLSVTVLPKNTLCLNTHENIVSELEINNYIKNKINYNYYFKEISKRKLYELDLALMHNETKYDLNYVLKNNAPTETYSFDKGLTIKGTVNNITNNKNDKVRLFSMFDGIDIIADLNDNNEFTFENIVAIDSSVYFLSLLSSDNKPQKIAHYTRLLENNKTFKKNVTLPKFSCQNITITKSENYTNAQFPKLNNVIELENVVIEDNNTKVLENKNQIYNKGIVDGYKITDDVANSYIDVLSFIRSHGFNVYTNGSDIRVSSRIRTSINGDSTPAIFLDNIPISNLNEIAYLSLKEVSEIYINKHGHGMGMGGQNGSIRIYRKIPKTKINNYLNEIKSKAFDVKDGFIKPALYKNPNYLNYNNTSFAQYGTIDFIYSVYTEDDGSFEFSIPHFYQDELVIQIQAIDNLGETHNKEFDIPVK